MSTQSRYRINATSKNAGPNQEREQVTFVINSDGYKQAWVDGRNVTRTGGTFKNEAGEDVEVKAGLYTVRDVFTLDKKTGGGARKSKVITATDFIAAAKEKGIHLPKKLADLAAEMGVMPTEAEPASSGEGASESAAA